MKVIKKYLFLAVLIFTLAGLQACKNNTDYGTNSGNNNNGGNNANTIVIQGMSFSPGSKMVNVGTTITWRNDDNVTHTVTSGSPGSPSGTFDSGDMANGATYSFTFANKGTFNYYCRIHTNMTGTIIVQ